MTAGTDSRPTERPGILYLRAADVEAAAPPAAVIRESVARTFLAKARNQTVYEPKASLSIAPGHFFQTLAGASVSQDRAMAKWVSIVAENARRGLPNVTALVVLNDVSTGQPLAILDGNWITATRTAAMSAIAAQHLARPDSRTIGFVGCGVQARSHLSALRSVLPKLDRVVAYSRTRRSSEAFAREARDSGLAAEVVDDPRAAVAGLDVIVTSVPAQPRLKPFLDPDWVSPGAFCSAVDLGRSWDPKKLRGAFAPLATDDHAQSAVIGASGKLAYPGPFDADLSDFVVGDHPGRRSPDERAMFLFPGIVLGDLAVATIVYETACAKRLGIELPR